MKKTFFLLAIAQSFFLGAQSVEYDNHLIKDLYTYALTEKPGYKWLRQLTDIGGRPAGSKEADEGVMLFKKIADSLGFATTLEPVKVPSWNRGNTEVAHFWKNGKKVSTEVCALGGSIATPASGIKAQMVEIHSFEQLDNFTDELKGKIAFYNIPMDPSFINTFFAYSNAVKQRYVGALEASKKGAIAVVTRSLSSSIDKYPHTGSMTYKDAETKIPAVAISTRGAEQLSKSLQQDPDLQFYFKTNCRWQDSVVSNNLIIDIKGTEQPDEVIITGGHIDSWDLGTGAHDDGAGCVHAFEAAYLLMKNDVPLKRTLRIVLFMNEEFGLSGAKTYARVSKEQKVNHVIAIESDAGGFVPRGISMVAPDSLVEKIKGFRQYLEPYGIHQFSQTGAGADISQLYDENLVMIGIRPDSHRYFDVHHSALDTFENVNPRELEMGSATVASLIYLLDRYDIIAKK